MKRTLFLVAVFVSMGLIAVSSDGLMASGQTKPSPTPTPTPKPTPNVLDDDTIYKVETELVNINVRVIDRDVRLKEDRASGQLKQPSDYSDIPPPYAATP